jgi:hypothetical protein
MGWPAVFLRFGAECNAGDGSSYTPKRSDWIEGMCANVALWELSRVRPSGKCNLTFGLRIRDCVTHGLSLYLLNFAPAGGPLLDHGDGGGPELLSVTWGVSSARTGLAGVFDGRNEEKSCLPFRPTERWSTTHRAPQYSGGLFVDPSRSRHSPPALPWARAPPPSDLNLQQCHGLGSVTFAA